MLVSRHGMALAELPADPVVGTSSRRRALQVRLLRPDARIVELRGNVDTRLRKAFETEVDAIVLAAAGVLRMGWQERITEVLSLDDFVPSPGQGALAIETRLADVATGELLALLDDRDVSLAVRAERAFLRAVGAGCTTPVGAHVSREARRWRLRAMLSSQDGSRVARADEVLDPCDADAQAAEVARKLLAEVAVPETGRGISNLSKISRGLSGTEHSTMLTDGAGTKTLPRQDRYAGVTAPPCVDAVLETVGDGLGDPIGGTEIPCSGLPLSGIRVLVTRARAQAAPLSAALQAAGAIPLELPTIRVAEPADREPLRAALRRLPAGGFDWIVFTSANAVSRVIGEIVELGFERETLSGVRIAAIGEATSAAVRQAGFHVRSDPGAGGGGGGCRGPGRPRHRRSASALSQERSGAGHDTGRVAGGGRYGRRG